jgi:hypothetical protein
MKKKAKRYQDGGLAGIAKTAQDLMGQVDNAAEAIKTGGGAGGLNTAIRGVGFTAQPIFEQSRFTNLGMRPISLVVPQGGINSPYKKGGVVKSASARADGIAIRGKTRA